MILVSLVSLAIRQSFLGQGMASNKTTVRCLINGHFWHQGEETNLFAVAIEWTVEIMIAVGNGAGLSSIRSYASSYATLL